MCLCLRLHSMHVPHIVPVAFVHVIQYVSLVLRFARTPSHYFGAAHERPQRHCRAPVLEKSVFHSVLATTISA